MIKLIQDGLSDGTFDANIPPMFLIIPMMVLGGPGQLIFRAMEGRSPFPPPTGGQKSWDRMLQILLRGVGKPSSTGGSS
jgi:hypothetical protein